jgi:peptidoglycan/LPS O-acetylase OafA/YrhL
MLLIIEILLTIGAWRKGWRSRALLPLGIGLSAAFFIGLAVGASGGDTSSLAALCLPLDLIMIVVLAVMASHAPKAVEQEKALATASPVEAPTQLSKT